MLWCLQISPSHLLQKLLQSSPSYLVYKTIIKVTFSSIRHYAVPGCHSIWKARLKNKKKTLLGNWSLAVCVFPGLIIPIEWHNMSCLYNFWCLWTSGYIFLVWLVAMAIKKNIQYDVERNIINSGFIYWQHSSNVWCSQNCLKSLLYFTRNIRILD